MNVHDYERLQRVVEIGERFFSYFDAGGGTQEPVILLHGMPTWGFLWHPIIPALARSRRVLVPDLLGFGRSDKRDRFDRSIARQAEALQWWMTRLGVERAALVGHDIGGGVAMRLAALAPQRVTRICLMNSISYDSWPDELMLQLGHPATRRTLSARTATRLLARALRRGFAASPAPGVIEALVAPYGTEVGKLSLIRNAVALDTNLTMEVAFRLPRLNLPVLMLWGQEDRFQPVRYAERLAWDIPDAHLVRIQKARHFVMFDRPDEVTAELVRFLEAPLPRPRLGTRVGVSGGG